MNLYTVLQKKYNLTIPIIIDSPFSYLDLMEIKNISLIFQNYFSNFQLIFFINEVTITHLNDLKNLDYKIIYFQQNKY